MPENFGAKDFLKLRLRVRRAFVPTVAEIVILGVLADSVLLSNVRVPKPEVRREVDG